VSRISAEVLIGAEATVRAMDLKRKETLVDELYRAQPHVLASFLVQQRLRVSPEKMEFLIELMLICFKQCRTPVTLGRLLPRMSRIFTWPAGWARFAPGSCSPRTYVLRGRELFAIGRPGRASAT
jgi:hypothetical protein